MARLQLKFSTATSTTHGLVIYFFFFLIPVLVLSDDKGERDYMLKLMRSLSPAPSNWSDKTDICTTWTGVYCDSGYVYRIDLRSKSLKGTLPSGLNDSLFSLTKIDLGNNSLSGPLPSFANLQVLHDVLLKDNNFTSIPPGCFQGLIGLQTLELSTNLNLPPWNFPTDLNASSALAALDLRATNLIGFLPDNTFHSFPNLLYVDLSNNSLSGVLPQSFASSKISTLWLAYNNLSGTIEILSSLTQLNNVELEGNRFEGPIPDLSTCPDLEWLNLKDNQLTGVVPPSLMNLSRLFRVSLDNNWLQGPLPVFDSSVDVSTSSNSFCLEHAGPCDERVNTLLQIAAAFGYPLLLARSWRGNHPCKGWRFITCDDGGSIIRTVNLTKLNLTGTISAAFANLTGLQKLYLNGNNLQGSIPESLATLPQLQLLDVSYNNLSGTIPKFSDKVKFIDTGNAFLRHSQPWGTTTLWIAGVLVACVGVAIIFVVVIYIHKRCLSVKKRTLIDKKFEDFMKNYSVLTLKKYSYSEIKRMTHSFRDKLGQGGYGIVYKASLTDGREVAVKVLSESDGSNGEEFINEVASISRMSHVNIVSLLGFCYEKNKRALIYEFMPNGSLDKFLHTKGSSNVICDLDWNTLFQITISIARGLEYLHRGCNTRILHLDIKPQNILLDEDFTPKIADFGLATICRKKESVVSIVGTRGTPGYIAPEVFSRTYGGVSHKSDVYSYGMLILEVIGARKKFDRGQSSTSEMYFPDWIYKDLEQGNIRSRYVVNTEEENEILLKITLVSLWCIQPNPSDRPSMSKVVEMLEGPLHSMSYPPKPILYSPKRPSSQILNISDSDIQELLSITA